MSREAEIEQLNKDKEFAKNALRVYLQHFVLLARAEVLEDLVVELSKEGTIDTDWIEIY